MKILTKKELKECLEADSFNYKKQTDSAIKRILYNLSASPMADQKYIWLYIKTLRYVEYYKSNYASSRALKKLFFIFRYTLKLSKLRKLSYKTGLQIPPLVCGKGLTIWHFGQIIINERTIIGNDCTLYPGILIGHKTPGGKCPTIGDNVFIGAGTKIIGDVKIGNNVIIGQNCVITHDISSGSKVVNLRNSVCI